VHMTYIKSMEDLARARDEALKRQQAEDRKSRFHIQVGMSSCGIAVGARDTLEAFHRSIADQNLPQIRVTQTGCIGLCALEPIVQVQMPGQPMITYGKVTPEVAHRIVEEHLNKGKIVQEYVVENI
jgi:NADP-reducing hydrogenase subunit HndB